MTAYELVTELEQRIDYWKVRGRPEHEPVAVYASPNRRWWGEIPIRPRLLGRTATGLFRYQFTMNQARRLVAALRRED